MLKRHGQQFAALLMLCLLAGQSASAAEDESRYQIEVLIFAQQPGYQRSSEVWRDRFDPAVTAQAISLEQTSRNKDAAYQAMPTAELQLTAAAGRIRSAVDLRLLAHLGWRQPVRNRSAAESVLIQAGDRFGDAFELEGTITFSRNRYLHVESDLFLSTFKAASLVTPNWRHLHSETPAMGKNAPDLATAQKDPDFVRDTTARLKQSRRLRTDELHYIDHPLFGVVLQVSRLPDKEN